MNAELRKKAQDMLDYLEGDTYTKHAIVTKDQTDTLRELEYKGPYVSPTYVIPSLKTHLENKEYD